MPRGESSKSQRTKFRLVQSFAALGLDSQHAYRLAKNSFEASFLDTGTKCRYLEQLDEFFEGFAALN